MVSTTWGRGERERLDKGLGLVATCRTIWKDSKGVLSNMQLPLRRDPSHPLALILAHDRPYHQSITPLTITTGLYPSPRHAYSNQARAKGANHEQMTPVIKEKWYTPLRDED
jgi:hypothetical protein